MSRLSALVAVLALLALPVAAQVQTCSLEISVTCTPGSNSSSCVATTVNTGASSCSGEIYTGFFTEGAGKILGSSNSLGLTDCIDSSFFPDEEGSGGFAFCFGSASIPAGGRFTTSGTVTGSTQVLAFTGVFDPNNPEDEGTFVIAQSGSATLTCQPTISSPPVTRSGLDYQVSWTAVSDPSAQFIVEESTSPDFTSGVNSTQVNGLSRTYRHDVSSTTTYYYRVRPTNCVGGTAQSSEVTSTVVQAPPAATNRNPEATVPLGTTQPVSIEVFIPGSGSTGTSALADPTFTATTDKPYLTVNPPSGTIPPGGTTVTVTAAPGSLPAGASTGTLKVTSNGTTKNTPVSVNLVTPVAPAGKSAPAPTALIIPVVTHVNGVAGPFLSDVRLTNGSGTSSRYQVTLTPTRTDGTKSSKATPVTVGSQETVALNDIVKNFFGLGATGAQSDIGFGSLEIKSLDAANALTFASSRTYASTAAGTFGQFVAAVPFASFATRRQSSIPLPGAPTQRAVTKLSLQQISQSSRFRTNFGIAEGAGEPASGVIRIIEANGSVLREVPFSLQPGEQQQINSFVSANGVSTLENGRLEVEIQSQTGAVTAYASVLDNVTTDPLAVYPVDVESVSSTRYVIPGIAELNNGASNFHSDMRILNGGTSDVTVNVQYFPLPGLGSPQTAQPIVIRRGEIRVIDNVLPALFNLSTGGGSLVLTTNQPSSLVATARTYTSVGNNGTYGQFIPGLSSQEGVGRGERALQVLQLEQSDQFRSNLGLVEMTGNAVTAKVTLYIPESKVTPSIDVPLEANGFVQLNKVIEGFMGAGVQLYNARVSVQVTSGNGRVSAYASVIDNQSFDPTYVPAQ